MVKIEKIKFYNHPVLGDLEIDFRDKNGNVINTIIIAGENGCGKSTILNEIYKVITCKFDAEMEITFNVNGFPEAIRILKNENTGFHIENKRFGNSPIYNKTILESEIGKNTKAIFSDVDINFNSNIISSVTSSELDIENKSLKSSNDLPTQINQLIIDIQALDDAEISRAVKAQKNVAYKDLNVEERMSRFTTAFNKMFEDLQYDGVINIDNHKSIIFKKNGKNVEIQNLSSGEKQIVYRGCFMLKDINALSGALVLIDEPEISLHPRWQEKILDYYKDIFTDSNGIQTSQLFVVTHSPFIIHNKNRNNDKIIVLSRNEDGKIVINDKPEYYKCDSLKVVEDAFSLTLESNIPNVLLEGRTDEMYFNKAAEVYDIHLPFSFKWVGHLNENGVEENTGKDALNKAVQFLKSLNLSYKNMCLYDCDTNKNNENFGNILIRSVKKFDNNKNIKIGIENALVLDDIDLSEYYITKDKISDYGEVKSYQEFQKMKLCEYICNLDKEKAKSVLANLKVIIEEIVNEF